MDLLERGLSEIHRTALFESMSEPEKGEVTVNEDKCSLISYRGPVLLHDLQGGFLTAVVTIKPNNQS